MPLLPSTSPYDDATREALVGMLDALVLDVLALSLIVRKAERTLSDECEAVCCLCRLLQKHAGKLDDLSIALGGSPPGTAEEIAERHRIDDWPDGLADDEAIRRELADRIAQLSGWVADGIKTASGLGAADVLTLLAKLLRKLGDCGRRIGRSVAAAETSAGDATSGQAATENGADV